MIYSEAKANELEGLKKVITNYGICVIKAHEYLLKINPMTKIVGNQVYLCDNSLLSNLLNL